MAGESGAAAAPHGDGQSGLLQECEDDNEADGGKKNIPNKYKGRARVQNVKEWEQIVSSKYF